MPQARKVIVDESIPQVFHCVSRCVRRAFLCGEDAYSGRSYEHRRGWVRDRLRELSEVFAVDVYAYAVMSNHLHVVLRTDAERAGDWSAEEVVLRWRSIFPEMRDENGAPVLPEGEELARQAGNAEVVGKWRGRLASVSWLMRCLNEKIARRANKEDECKGRFWEGRFRCQRIEDAQALLACMVYVDLNPVRAGIAEGLAESDFTSVQDRVCAKFGREKVAKAPRRPNEKQREELEKAREESGRDKWLASIERVRLGGVCRVAEMVEGKREVRKGENLAWKMGEDEYLKLVEASGRCVRGDKKGALGAEALPVLEGMRVEVEEWERVMSGYGRLYWLVAGSAASLAAAARAAGQQWFWGSGRRRAAEV